MMMRHQDVGELPAGRLQRSLDRGRFRRIDGRRGAGLRDRAGARRSCPSDRGTDGSVPASWSSVDRASQMLDTDFGVGEGIARRSIGAPRQVAATTPHPIDDSLMWSCPSTSSTSVISYVRPSWRVARRFISAASANALTTCTVCAFSAWDMRRPYLGLFREEADRCLAFMPAVQGAMKWPTQPRRPRRAGRRTGTAASRSPLSIVSCSCMRSRWRTIRRRCCAKSGACWRRAAALLVVVQTGAALGAHGYDAVRPRPALFAFADHAAHARDLVHADRLGRSACICRRWRAAGFCGRGRVGARRRDHCDAVRRRAHRRGAPSRSIGLFRHGASDRALCRRSSRRWRLRRRARSEGPAAGSRVLFFAWRLVAAGLARCPFMSRAAMAPPAAMQREAVALRFVAILSVARWRLAAAHPVRR